MNAPSAMEFAKQRLGGSLQSAFEDPEERVDVGRWMPLLSQMARAPGAGGLLRNAFISQLSNVMRRPYIPEVRTVNLNELDDALEQGAS
jgi:hypothetical protein